MATRGKSRVGHGTAQAAASKNDLPPQYPIGAEEALRLVGKFPKPRKELPGAKLTAEDRMRNAIAGAMSKVRRNWRLRAWKDPNTRSYVFDRDEIEQKKNERFTLIEPK